MDPISITTGIITLFAVIRKIQRFRRDVAEAGNLLRDLERDCTLTLDLIRNCKRNLDRLELIMGGSFIYDGDDIRKKLTKIIQELDPDLKALGREIARLALEPQNRFELWRNAARRALPLPSKLSDKHKEIVKKRKEFEKLQSALDSQHLVTIMARQMFSPEDLRFHSVRRRRRSSVMTTESVLLETELGAGILLDAIDGRHYEDVKMILSEIEISPNISTDDKGRAPLHIASARGDANLVELLLKHKADIGATDDEGSTPLHLAAARDRSEVVKLLLDGGGGSEGDDERDSAVDLSDDRPPLPRANPRALNNKGHSPLALAAWHGVSAATLRQLTDLGPDLVRQRCTDPDMPSALFAAAAAGHLATAQALLAAGADAKMADAAGRTLLHLPHWPAAAALAPLLLARGADPRARDGRGQEPIHAAAQRGRRAAARAVLAAAPAAAHALDGEAAAVPLIHSAEAGAARLVRDLVEGYGADAGVADAGGNSAFLAACAGGHVAVAAYLLGRNGGDVDAANSRGHSALCAAAQRGRTETARWLLAMGADASLVTREGLDALSRPLEGPATAANLARAMGHDETAAAIEGFDEEAADEGRLEWTVQCRVRGAGDS